MFLSDEDVGLGAELEAEAKRRFECRGALADDNDPRWILPFCLGHTVTLRPQRAEAIRQDPESGAGKPQNAIRSAPDAAREHLGEGELVEESSFRPRDYAVAWEDGRGSPRAGKLELRDMGIRLETGANNGRLRVLALRYDAVERVRMARGGERLAGCPTLVLERVGKAPVRVVSVVGLGVLSELSEELARRTGSSAA